MRKLTNQEAFQALYTWMYETKASPHVTGLKHIVNVGECEVSSIDLSDPDTIRIKLEDIDWPLEFSATDYATVLYGPFCLLVRNKQGESRSISVCQKMTKLCGWNDVVKSHEQRVLDH